MLRIDWKFQYPAADLAFALIVTPVADTERGTGGFGSTGKD